MAVLSQFSSWRVAGAQFLVVAGLVCAATAAGAQSAVVKTFVVAVPGTVSLSRPQGNQPGDLPLTTYAGYKVTLDNSSPNATSRARFRAAFDTVLYAGDLVAPTGPITTANPVSCYPENAALDGSFSQVACDVGPTSGTSVQFHLAVKAPATMPTNSKWTVNWASFIGAVPADIGTVYTSFVDSLPTDTLFSFVPVPNTAIGVDVFTGNSAKTSRTDKTSTRVVVQTATRVSTVTIDEKAPAYSNYGSCTSANLAKCAATNLAIPDAADGWSMIIYLRRDASTVKNNSNVQVAEVFYQHTDAEPFASLDSCLSSPAALGKPCVVSKEVLADGSWLFTLFAIDNGKWIY